LPLLLRLVVVLSLSLALSLAGALVLDSRTRTMITGDLLL